MTRFTIRVFNDHGPDSRDYSVPAETELDARVLAFVLDLGIEGAKYGGGSTIEAGEVELAKTYTEVIGYARASD